MLLDLISLIKKYNLNIRGVYHIGANLGQELEVYNEIESIKDVLLFEPDPNIIMELVSKACSYESRFRKIETFWLALGPEKKEGIFYVADNEGQSNSLLEPSYHKIQYPNVLFNDTIIVKVMPLDEIYTHDSFPVDCNFINMDVQGYELEVLKGATKTLQHIDYIMCEVNNTELYKGGCLVEHLDEFLQSYNFKRVETSWEGETWGDALYIKGNNNGI